MGEKEVAVDGKENWERAGPPALLLEEAETAAGSALKVPFKLVLVVSLAEGFGLLPLSTFWFSSNINKFEQK